MRQDSIDHDDVTVTIDDERDDIRNARAINAALVQIATTKATKTFPCVGYHLVSIRRPENRIEVQYQCWSAKPKKYPFATGNPNL